MVLPGSPDATRVDNMEFFLVKSIPKNQGPGGAWNKELVPDSATVNGVVGLMSGMDTDRTNYFDLMYDHDPREIPKPVFSMILGNDGE